MVTGLLVMTWSRISILIMDSLVNLEQYETNSLLSVRCLNNNTYQCNAHLLNCDKIHLYIEFWESYITSILLCIIAGCRKAGPCATRCHGNWFYKGFRSSLVKSTEETGKLFRSKSLRMWREEEGIVGWCVGVRTYLISFSSVNWLTNVGSSLCVKEISMKK